ncbi:hypothetical protein AQUSIP_22100 [Aquicella siphonis]|uniref:Type IV pilus biogenesis protein PilP n=1 Tax=Aquicella siphonis TaxID=254247 RepID=A0A5E4PKM6_9COXI|nr:hypothetical protein [Aquicella siphonis]VVC76883.1 hypothetical protein AQUSIP_22100 [Aquicella siphonis]
MTSDKMQALASMTTRQKVIAGVVVVVVLILVWQLKGLFGGGGGPAKPAAAPKTMTATKPGGADMAMAPGAAPAPMTPKPAEIPQAQPMSEREAEIMKLQQETQAKYLEALNELQMLKLSRDIAITNKDISSAKLAKVVSEKKIVDLLTPPAPPSSSEVMTKNVQPISSLGDQEVKYSVVSVSQLQYRWSAVLGYKGSLFNVNVGDVLPPDGSTVESIGRDGVTLNKDGVKKKVSLVPTI